MEAARAALHFILICGADAAPCIPTPRRGTSPSCLSRRREVATVGPDLRTRSNRRKAQSFCRSDPATPAPLSAGAGGMQPDDGLFLPALQPSPNSRRASPVSDADYQSPQFGAWPGQRTGIRSGIKTAVGPRVGITIPTGLTPNALRLTGVKSVSYDSPASSRMGTARRGIGGGGREHGRCVTACRSTGRPIGLHDCAFAAGHGMQAHRSISSALMSRSTRPPCPLRLLRWRRPWIGR